MLCDNYSSIYLKKKEKEKKLSKNIEYTTARVNHNINYGFWMIMCQCRFIIHNKCTIPGWDIDNGGRDVCGEWRGQKAYGKYLYLPLNFVA